ncbi:Ribosomal protein L17 [Candidatus Omnitrophus magneticus]|uniref:50S ribosomal protein L17 n=1 Tax=Candidatus Omnitrophus magneticus TaxID=1609969 RepID=A0A0F0CSC9_9BACT|nr:Ribosomal protein L17 [Candidatus Omnitrophus magneticus]
MRHKKKRGLLSRNISHRKATLKNMALNLFKYQRIVTTLAKAKALKAFVEPIITVARQSENALNAKRLVCKKLCDRDVVKIVFETIAPLYKNINGGYTRIIPFKNRKGDGASLVILEFTKRTRPEEDLLGNTILKVLSRKPTVKQESKDKKPEVKKEATRKKGSSGTAAHHSAPEIAIEEKEEHVVEDVRKEKARVETKKVAEQGFFKRFRRKSI